MVYFPIIHNWSSKCEHKYLYVFFFTPTSTDELVPFIFISTSNILTHMFMFLSTLIDLHILLVASIFIKALISLAALFIHFSTSLPNTLYSISYYSIEVSRGFDMLIFSDSLHIRVGMI